MIKKKLFALSEKECFTLATALQLLVIIRSGRTELLGHAMENIQTSLHVQCTLEEAVVLTDLLADQWS